MNDAVKPIPEGYHSVTPYLIVKGAAGAIEFYKKTLGATELMRFPATGERIAHAEIAIGDSRIMLADEFPDMGIRGPQSPGGSAVIIHVYLEDVDAVASRMTAAGATVQRPVQDQFYGDRSGSFVDPFGHAWNIATHKEDIAPDEMRRRAEKAMKG